MNFEEFLELLVRNGGPQGAPYGIIIMQYGNLNDEKRPSK